MLNRISRAVEPYKNIMPAKVSIQKKVCICIEEGYCQYIHVSAPLKYQKSNMQIIQIKYWMSEPAEGRKKKKTISAESGNRSFYVLLFLLYSLHQNHPNYTYQGNVLNTVRYSEMYEYYTQMYDCKYHQSFYAVSEHLQKTNCSTRN